MWRTAVLAGLLIAACGCGGGEPERFDVIEYQGRTFAPGKSYDDFDDYKEDPDNLPAAVVPEIQRLVRTAPVARRYAGREALTHAVFALQFPGFGLSTLGETRQADGSALALFGVEIPRAGESRYLLFHRSPAGNYALVDDFAHPDDDPLFAVARNGDRLAYTSQQGKTMERTAAAP